MLFHTYKIERYAKQVDGSYSSTPELITDVINISVSEGLGNRADTFSYTVFDDGSLTFNDVSINDRILVYKSYDGVVYTLLIDGIVEEKRVKAGIDDSSVTITGINRLEKLFNSLVQTTGETVAKTADAWIRLILDQVNANNPDLQIGWAAANPSLSNVYAKPFIRDYVQAFSLIEELSQPDMTDGKVYIYYINSANELVWIPRPAVTSAYPSYATEFKSLEVSKGIWNVVNAFIMYCGTTPYGTAITLFDYDVLSVNKNGWKTKPVLAQKLAEDLQGREWASMVSQVKYSDGSRFPSDYTGGYRMSDGTVVTNDGEFNNHFVDLVLAEGERKAKLLLRKLAYPAFRTRGDYVFDEVNALGDKVSVTFADAGWSSESKELRVLSLNHNFSVKGWSSSFSIEQDDDQSAIDLNDFI